MTGQVTSQVTGQVTGNGSSGGVAGGAAFAAAMVRASARGIAAAAAESLLSREPAAKTLFGRDAFRTWQENLSHRLAELAASLEAGEPGLFAGDISWSRAAFESRSVPASLLAASLRALRESLAESLPAAAWAVASGTLDRGIEAAETAAPALHRLNPDDHYGKLALRYLGLALEGRRAEAVGVLLAEFQNGASAEDLYERVLLPAEAEAGTMWHLGELSVPEEHAATETTRGAMAVLCHEAGRRRGPLPASAPAVLVGAVAGDRHDIGVRAVADILELAGFRAVSLGGDVPADDFAQAVADFGAAGVVLAATMSLHLGAARETVSALRAATAGRRPALAVIVGGRAFAGSAALAAMSGADAFAASPRDAVTALRDVLDEGRR